LVTDVMALRGDTVDNVPGAPGIGEKGSVAIIRQFGSLTAALDKAGEVTRKQYRESLLCYRAQIELSHRLVTIDCAVPVEASLGDMRLQAPDEEVLTDIYRELEFASLLRKEQLDAVEGFAEVVPPDRTETATAMTEAEADAALDSIL